MTRASAVRVLAALALSTALGTASTAGIPSASSRKQPSSEVDRIAALLKSNLYPEAAALADAALARGGIDPKTEAVCGLAILKTGRIEEAEAVLKRANARGLGLPDAALGLGRIARARNDSDGAMPLLLSAVKSDLFYEEGARHLWRTAADRGFVQEMRETASLIEARFAREKKPSPDWLINALTQARGMTGPRFGVMGRPPDHVVVPLRRLENTRIRMVSMRLNGRGEYPIDIDSASADFLILSPLLAEELGLPLEGSSRAVGVGTNHAGVRFGRLDRVEMSGIVFANVPVMVSDLHVFRGLKKGLLGTALLKRFNVSIDVRAGQMHLYALDRPDLLLAGINRDAVAADVPLFLFDATMVRASMAGAPEALYILDSAAATNLVDARFFREHIKPRLDPSRIVAGGIRGAQGEQRTEQVDGLEVRLGALGLGGLQAHEFSMAALNAIGERYAAGLLGNPILWPYRCHFDFRNGRLILERY